LSSSATGTAGRPTALTLVWRLALATGFALLLSHWYARDIVSAAMPLLSWGLGVVADEFQVLSLQFMTDRHNQSLVAMVRLEHTLLIGNAVVVPDGVSVMTVGSAIGNVLQPMLVTLVVVLAWPASIAEMATRVACAGLLQVVVLLLNTPLSMAAWLWIGYMRHYSPDAWSALLPWNIFLNGGGRIVMGLVAAALSIALAHHLARPRLEASAKPAAA